MIVYDLSCPGGHRFEGWFSSSDDFESQQQRALVACPQCGSAEVTKAPMAPAVPMKGNRRTEPRADNSPVPLAAGIPPEVSAAMEKLAAMQTEALKNSKWVGEKFAEQSRAMHFGEREPETIHGKASVKEAQALIEEGIAIAPLPFAVTPPEELN